MSLQSVGQSIPRRDARQKVTGAVPYTVNLDVPGCLHARLLRSPLPHARLLNVEATAARRIPGVRAVFTREEMRHLAFPRFGAIFADQPIVADDRVRYVGDTVAAVAATDAATAEAAVQAISVDYDPLPAVTSPLEALKDDAPRIHEITAEWAFKTFKPIPDSNVCHHERLERGEVERAFNDAAVVVEETYHTQVAQHCHLEPHVAIASFDATGKLTVWSSTQTPFSVREQLGRIFGLSHSRVRVIVSFVGGGYGAKVYPKIEPVAASLAQIAQKPVRLLLSREEVFLTITKHGAVVFMKTGFAKDGRMLAQHSRAYFDTGAYADSGPVVSNTGGLLASGPYHVPNCRLETSCIYTNKPAAGPFRGFGAPQVTLALEAQIDMAAHALGLDPLDVRKLNAARDGEHYVTGATMESMAGVECLEAAAAAIGWRTPGPIPTSLPRKGSVRGMGLATSLKNTYAPPLSGAIVRMEADGSVQVNCGMVEIGQGGRTLICQLVAETLGISVEAVELSEADTDFVPYDQGTIASRSTVHMGRAVVAASAEVKEKLFSLASADLEASPGDLEVVDGAVCVHGAPNRTVPIHRLVNHTGGFLLGHGVSQDFDGIRRLDSVWMVAAGAAEVNVDLETGKVTVLRYVTAADVGRAINPRLCHAQLDGSALMGIGQAFFEEMRFENGQPVNASFLDYKIPSILDKPGRIDSILIEKPQPDGPYEAKGVGEIAVVAPAAAIANAVYHATGARLTELPMTPEKVLRALRGQPA